MFERLPALEADPILGLVEAYKSDNNPNKVDLGAGVYKNEEGNTPIMTAVSEAQRRWLKYETTKVYAPPTGFSGFNKGMIHLVMGEDHPVVKEGRIASVQTPGGCGALRVGAGMLNRCQKKARVWVSTPTWANHIPLLSSAGLELLNYPYYNSEHHKIDFDLMIHTLAAMESGDVILLHGCCHNPCGADLSKEQWKEVAELIVDRGAIPFIDVAYQGLGDGLDTDAWGLRYLARHCPEMVIANSCSKNFGLYRERVGAVMVITADANVAAVCSAQLQNVAREIYSMPPSYGAALVDIILQDDELKKNWQDELTLVRKRISGLRDNFVDCLSATDIGDRFDYIKKEKGMFSFLGISKAQVQRLKTEFSIYMVDSSRINLAGLNSKNMEYVVNSVLSVIE